MPKIPTFPDEPTPPTDHDIELEAAAESAEGLKLEARQEAAEHLRLEALEDGVKDVEREAKIDELELAGELVALSQDEPIGRFAKGGWDSGAKRGGDVIGGIKIVPAPIEKGKKNWYTLPTWKQSRELQRIMGTYRPPRDAPKDERTAKRLVRDGAIRRGGSLKENGDGPADAILKAGKPKPRPQAAVALPDPIKGSCLQCGKDLPRYGIRADAKFCQGNNNSCSNEYRYRKKLRDEADRVFNTNQQGEYADRMLSLHRHAAGAMRSSADRLGLDVNFVATAEGVMAIHSKPLPPLARQFSMWVETGEGYLIDRVGVAADTAEGTLFTFEVPRSGVCKEVWIEFEGDPGPTYEPKAPEFAQAATDVSHVRGPKRSSRRIRGSL